MKVEEVKTSLARHANAVIAQHSQRFFKTEPGEYGAGDRFIGIRVPVIRAQAAKFSNLPLKEVELLLRSDIHEERLCALIMLVNQYTVGGQMEKEAIYNSYLGNTKYINNWDLVDCSAAKVVGAHLQNSNRSILDRLAVSDSLWERRIAIIATHWFIRMNEFDDTLRIAECLLTDEHDLIHKAVGWMLREVGKRNQVIEEDFLLGHYPRMPRTMLRYAIEKFPKARRQQYLKGTAHLETLHH